MAQTSCYGWLLRGPSLDRSDSVRHPKAACVVATYKGLLLIVLLCKCILPMMGTHQNHY